MVISHYVDKLLHLFSNFCVNFLLRYKDAEETTYWLQVEIFGTFYLDKHHLSF